MAKQDEFLEQLKRLEKYAGEPIILRIESITETCTGNLDEGERWDRSTNETKENEYVLDKVYGIDNTAGWEKKKSILPKFVHVYQPGRGPLLIPFEYRYCPGAHLRVSCTMIIEAISEIKTKDGFRIQRDYIQNYVSWVFDGYGSVLRDGDGIYSEEDIKDYQRYPQLSGQSAGYDRTLGGITGNIEALIRDCEPLW